MTTMTAEAALSAREPLMEAVTAVLPILSGEEDDISPEELRRRYGAVFAVLGLSADSPRDLALITGAVETARWVTMSAELAGVDPQRFWSNYVAETRRVA